MSIAIKLMCMLLLLTPLSHGAVAPIRAEISPNCNMILAKLRTNKDLYEKLQFFSKQSEIRFEDWESTNFKSRFRKNSYFRALKELRDSSLLLYFNSERTLQERNLLVNVVWPIEGEVDLKDASFVLPGFYPLSASQLSLIEGFQLKVKEQIIELEYLMSPADYCFNEKILIQTKDQVFKAQNE